MGYRDLQAFISALEQRSQLVRVKAEVDHHLEITEIVDRVSKAGGPALLFENVKDSPYPLLINAFGSNERMCLALGVKSLDDIGAVIGNFFEMSNYSGMVNKIRSLPRLARLATVFPLKVPSAPCQEVVEHAPDLSTLPVLTCWPGDGGPFVTLPLVITRDPETGLQNMGMYRLQVYDRNTTGMHWHVHKDGRSMYERYKAAGVLRMPVSVALGGDPATIYSATAPLPPEINEMMLAGFLRKMPLEIVKCKTNELYVPARAEFILEGYVDTQEDLREEGPFGDHTGYYSLKGMFPVFHVECITRRKNPVYPATVVGKPPMEDCWLGKATERIFLPILRAQLPEIVDMHFPLEGVFHNCLIVSIRKRYPGHARKVMHALWGMGQMMYTKMIVVVDEQISPADISTVAWKVFNNIDAARDLVVVDGPLDELDHASPLPRFGHKLGVDATRKWPEEGHLREWPEDVCMTPEIKRQVDRRWEEYGL